MHLISANYEEAFQALADPTRIRIVRLLVQTGEECCLCELVDGLDEPQYKLSRHLKTLRQAGLLTAERDGRWVYHRLVAGVPHFDHLYEAVRALPDGDGAFAVDMARFRKCLCLREDGRCRRDIPSASSFAKET
ncbi:ArsR/SmtB family transcription factor [Ralstonia pseudosolanacearum]|uniref:ArsR/SmtB family transcription factor n=1 Tax=Ralstonia pseudosolanacearum TaxID=1310165 RepID=UPI0008F7FF27|nr:metalloregulator ArsR/SmtB family transcription factor [Ralstonia pseudosolanacearum]API73549.1 transcriptional regulator [Ralstonia pseudosolanacearum]NKA07773.1 ArsR family transcriptional regulator [Ralstonia solanacearum]OIN73215.1 transcriptional regulator [Ralstonia solanacearum]QWF61534.1 metalloregulator ArsR/SmtB family transcription factor [Ralstonia solanacearum]